MIVILRKCTGWLMALLALSAVSCGGGETVVMKSPPGYNLNQPFVIKLPPMLDEISGLVYYPKDKSVFAIVDENGVLFKIALHESPVIEKWRFNSSGDYEDLVLVDSTFYAMMSDGSLVRFGFNGKEAAEVQQFPLNLPGKNEFEICYAEKGNKRLVLVCKDCEGDKKEAVSAYGFDPETGRFAGNVYAMEVAPIARELGEEDVRFKPSAAALHPLTGELYMISAVNDVLVVADRKGTIKQVYRLDPKTFKQPEGLCFTPEGHLIISNESADIGAANILIFKYKSVD